MYSLSHGSCGSNRKKVIFEVIFWFHIFSDMTNSIDNKSIHVLVEVINGLPLSLSPSHYLSQCWPMSSHKATVCYELVFVGNISHNRLWQDNATDSQYKDAVWQVYGIWISIMKIRQSHDHLKFTMENHMHRKTAYKCIETGPRLLWFNIIVDNELYSKPEDIFFFF